MDSDDDVELRKTSKNVTTLNMQDTSSAEYLQEEFLSALERGDILTFAKLLNHPKVNPKHKYGKPHFSTCLEIASRRHERGEFVKLLLTKVKPNVNVIVPEPIHYAAKFGYADSLEVLLNDKRTKASSHDSLGRTALHYACMNFHSKNLSGYEECIRLLMDKLPSCDINRADFKGFTAFHSAVKCMNRNGSEDVESKIRILKLMVDLGHDILDLDSSKGHGRTARESVLERFPEFYEILPMPTNALQGDPHKPLVDAMENDYFDVFQRRLFQTDTDGNPIFNPNQWFGPPVCTTLLEMACRKSDGEKYVTELLKAGADPNVPKSYKEQFPIHVLCKRGHHKSLAALFKYSKVKIDPNCGDSSGNTPLHYTLEDIDCDEELRENKIKCLQILLDQTDIDVNKENNERLSPFTLAKESKIKRIISMITQKSKFADTMVCINESVEELPQDDAHSTEYFSLQVFSQNVERNHNQKFLHNTLFELLGKCQQQKFAKFLKDNKHEIDLSAKNNDGQNTLLQRASRYGLTEAVEALLEEGADPNETMGDKGAPPLVLAAFYNHHEVIELLLNKCKGVLMVNKQDLKGNTALHYAARNRNLESVVTLLDNGADIGVINKLDS